MVSVERSSFQGTVARDFRLIFFMDLLSMGPRFRGWKDSSFVSCSRSYTNFSRIPRCRLQQGFKLPAKPTAAIVNARRSLLRLFWISAVAWATILNPGWSLQQRFCRITNPKYFHENTKKTVVQSLQQLTVVILNPRCSLQRLLRIRAVACSAYYESTL